MGIQITEQTVFLDPSFEWVRHPLWAKALSDLQGQLDVRLINFNEGVNPDPRKAPPQRYGEVQTRVSEGQDSSFPLGNLSPTEFQMFKQIAYQLFRRENRAGTQREVDSEVEFYLRLGNWRRLLKQVRPKVVLFPVTPHFVSSFTLMIAAKSLGINTLWFQPSSLAPMMLPRTSLSERVSVETSSQNLNANWSRIERILTESLERTDVLKEKPYIQKQRVASQRAKSFRGRVSAIRHSLLWLISDRFDGEARASRPYQLPLWVDRLLQVLFPRAISRRLAVESNRLSHRGRLPEEFATFALHYEPERTSTPESSLSGSQLEQVMLARALIPQEMDLLVREHESQLSPSLQGYLGRAPKLYEFLVETLGVKLDTTFPLTDIFANTSLVFTGTGNIAIESALRGVPVVYFGSPWWQGMPGSHHYPDVVRIGSTPSSLCAAEHREVKEFLSKRVLKEMIPGGASESMEELQNRFGSLGATFLEFAAERITDFLGEWLSEQG